jgi:hypothetical protein
MDVVKMRNAFAEGVGRWFDMEFMPMGGKLVYGVSFVPMHLYARGEPSLVGKTCVVLGRERGGGYHRQLNFVGGAVDDNDMRYCGKDVAKVLFDEVLEEFHLALTPALFGDMLLKVLTVPFGNGVSLVFVVHLKGVSRSVWDKEHNARVQSNAPWKFVEFYSIEHVPIERLMTQSDLSSYVRKIAAEVIPIANILTTNKGVHYWEFATAEVRGSKITTLW